MTLWKLWMVLLCWALPLPPSPPPSPDKIKDAVVAKVAMQASDLYAEAHSSMAVGTIKAQWDRVSGEEGTYIYNGGVQVE